MEYYLYERDRVNSHLDFFVFLIISIKTFNWINKKVFPPRGLNSSMQIRGNIKNSLGVSLTTRPRETISFLFVIFNPDFTDPLPFLGWLP